MSEPTIEEMRENRCRDLGSKEELSCSLQDGHDGDHVAFPLHDHNRGILEQWTAGIWLPAKDVSRPEKVCPSCKCPAHDGSCIQAGPLLTYAEQTAPESEDEAKERECGAYDLHDLHSFLNDIAKHLRNARARLDVERGERR